MVQDSIQQDVSQLRAEIEELNSLSAEERIKLNELVADIEAHAASSEHHSALNEQLEVALARFETSHPALSGVLRSIMNTLSNIGV